MTAHFGEILRIERLKKEYTLRNFAAQIEVSPTYLSSIERGESPAPSLDIIKKVALKLGQTEERWISLAGPARKLDLLWDILEKNPQFTDYIDTILSFDPNDIKKISSGDLRDYLDSRIKENKDSNNDQLQLREI